MDFWQIKIIEINETKIKQLINLYENGDQSVSQNLYNTLVQTKEKFDKILIKNN